MKNDTQKQLFKKLQKKEKPATPLKLEFWSLPKAREAWNNYLQDEGGFHHMALGVAWLFGQVRELRASNVYLKRKIKRMEEEHARSKNSEISD